MTTSYGFYLGDTISSIFNNKRVGYVMAIDKTLSCLVFTFTEINYTSFMKT